MQAILAANTNGERRGGTRQPSLLTGLVVDELGKGLTPSHAVKKGRRYHYYVSRHLITEGHTAADLEDLVVARLRDWLSDPAAISAVIDDDPPDASVHAALITQAQSLADRWPSLKPPEVKAYLNAIVRRIRVTSGCIAIEIDGGQAMAAILTGPDFASINKSRHDAYPANPITLTTPAVLKRAGTSMKLKRFS